MALFVPKNNWSVTACTLTESNGIILMNTIVTDSMNKESKILP